MAIEEVLPLWLSWAERLKVRSLFYEEDFKRAVLAIPEATYSELAEFYERAVRENHISQLDQWLRTLPRTSPMGDEELSVRRLVSLFGYIGQVRAEPFNSQSLSWLKTPAVPDWRKLPEEMHFLIPAALACQRFSYVHSEEGQEYVAEHATDEEKQLLRECAARIRDYGYERIRAWRRGLSVLDHIEASLVFGLKGCMDALDLDYYSPKTDKTT